MRWCHGDSPFVLPSELLEGVLGEYTSNPRERPTVGQKQDAGAVCRRTAKQLRMMSYSRERHRPLRGLCKFYSVDGPGVSLRFTPGFMPSSAPRTEDGPRVSLRSTPGRGPSRTSRLDCETLCQRPLCGLTHPRPRCRTDPMTRSVSDEACLDLVMGWHYKFPSPDPA